jgi:hypothetical protein
MTNQRLVAGDVSARRQAVRLLAIVVAAVSLSACMDRGPDAATPNQYEAALASWVGRSETELVRAWGVPSHSQLLSQGGEALEYVEHRGDEAVCTTLFTSNILGVIQSWTWRGSRCRVPRLGGAS